MATSPDFLRLASSASRALADTALDQVSHAVLVVDARHKHLPIVLANAAARQAFETFSLAQGLIETPLLDLLSLSSVQTVQYAMVDLSEASPTLLLPLSWDMGAGHRRAMTEIKLLAGAAGQRLVMLSLSQAVESADLAAVVDQMPLDLLILDADLKVTFANAGALRANAGSEGLIGASALDLIPTTRVPAESFAQALQGHRYRNEALGISSAGKPTRWFDIELRQLRAASGEVGLMVLFSEVGHRHSKDSSERRLLALTEHARDIISIADAEGRVQYVSGGVRNSLGYTSEERHSMYIFEHMHPDDYLDVYTRYQQLVAGKIGGFIGPEREQRRAVEPPLVGDDGASDACLDIGQRHRDARQDRRRCVRDRAFNHAVGGLRLPVRDVGPEHAGSQNDEGHKSADRCQPTICSVH